MRRRVCAVRIGAVLRLGFLKEAVSSVPGLKRIEGS